MGVRPSTIVSPDCVPRQPEFRVRDSRNPFLTDMDEGEGFGQFRGRLVGHNDPVFLFLVPPHLPRSIRVVEGTPVDTQKSTNTSVVVRGVCRQPRPSEVRLTFQSGSFSESLGVQMDRGLLLSLWVSHLLEWVPVSQHSPHLVLGSQRPVDLKQGVTVIFGESIRQSRFTVDGVPKSTLMVLVT